MGRQLGYVIMNGKPVVIKVGGKNLEDIIEEMPETFRGTSAKGLTEEQFLEWAITLEHDKNDYVLWDTVDEYGETEFKRYTWNGSQWMYEYSLPNTIMDEPVPGQGIITKADNRNNALDGKAFIATQDEFDSMIADANSGKAVNAVLGAGVFVVKTPIWRNNMYSDFRLTGSNGTVIKRNNRVFKRADADTSANTATHWACALGEEPIEPFSVFLDEKDNIIPISEYSHLEYMSEDYYRSDGKALSDSVSIESTSTGIFYIPKGSISIPSAQLPYVYGYLDSAYGIGEFKLTGNVVTITKYGTSDTVECLEAAILPQSYGSTNRNFPSRISSYKSWSGSNRFVLYNTPSDGNIWYDGDYMYIPNGVSSVEVVDGWRYYNAYDATDFGGRPQYFLWATKSNGAKFDVSGITFRGFQHCIYVADGVNYPDINGIFVRDCRFETMTGIAIRTVLSAPRGRYDEKETSVIENCEFIGCGLDNFNAVVPNARIVSWHGGTQNCYGTGVSYIEVKNCVFDGFPQKTAGYKVDLPAMQLVGDIKVSGSRFSNFAATHILIDNEGEITVDGCEFSNSEEFMDDKERTMQADFGFVYLGGANSHYCYPVTISNNVFHGLCEQYSDGERAIYLDEGRYNVGVVGNVVYDVQCLYAIDSRETSNADMHFYAWTNESDTIYTMSRKYYKTPILTYSEGMFTETGSELEMGTSTDLTEIEYDGKTWTYDSESDVDGLNWSSANVVYQENVVEGKMRLVHGDDVQDGMLPTVTKNLILGHYDHVLGSYTKTSNTTPDPSNTVDAGDNIVTDKYRAGNGVVAVDGSIRNSLTSLLKKKVVFSSMPNDPWIEAPAVSGETGQVVQLNAQGKPEWVTPSAGTTPDSAMSDSSTNAAQNKVVKAYVDEEVGGVQDNLDGLDNEVHDDYAKQDGYYDLLHAGEARNIEGNNPVEGVFTLRTAGGTDDIATGLSSIGKIDGNSVVWNNQKTFLNTPSYTTWTDAGVTIRFDGSTKITMSGLASDTKKIQNNRFRFSFPVGHKICYWIWNNNGKITGLSVTNNFYPILTTKKINTIYNNDDPYWAVRVENGVNYDGTVIYINLIDLTLMFGAGNEPTTVAQFEEWLSKNVGLRDYYPYNAGEIINCKVQGIKTVGFNLYDNTSGKAKLPIATNGNLTNGMDCYQITGTYTSIADESGTAITPTNGFFNSKTQTITVTGGAANTCIHLSWSGYRNGEYEAYWTETKPFDVTKIYGQLNGEGELVQVFPNGMCKAGDVRDALYVENGVTKAKVNTDKQSVTGAIGDTVTLVGCDTTATDFLCAKQIGTLSNGVLTLTAAATNVDVNYPLATPLIYTDLVCREDNVDTPFSLPINYKVDDYGTEEQVFPTPSTNELTSCAAVVSLIYGINAADFIKNTERNYVSIDRTENGTTGSFDQFLSALGTAMNGTWTKTWSSENNRWEFSFEATEETQPEEQQGGE